MERPRFFSQIPLTQQSTAQELLHGIQTHQLIKLGHLTESLEGKSLSQNCTGYQ
jgi:hypothetical protein